MIAGLKPYSSMKESGHLWLGDFPAHWDVRRNGRLFAQRIQTGYPALPILEVSLKTGVRVRDFETSDRKQVMSDKAKYKRAKQGDIAYNMMRMWQGAVGVAPVDGLVSPAYVVARPIEESNSAYFEHLFRTRSYMSEVNKYSRGIVSDRNRLYWEDFKEMPSPFPPPDEQAAIVRFLGYADRCIRRYIRAKQRLINLLEEQKQAIVHRAITRGLDPSVPLKPSGVQWLGDVPAHWDVICLRRVTNSRCDGPFGSGLKSSHYSQSGVRVVRLQNIGHAEFRDGEPAYVSHEHYATLGDHSVQAGDLLIAGLGDDAHPAGRACVAPAGIVPAMVKADCFRFRVESSRLDPHFAAFQMTSTANASSAILSRGATRQRVNLQSTSARELALPPRPEQVEIVTRITESAKSLGVAINSARREIDLLREYRSRLIGDVVTGKFDVREVAVRLPAETARPEYIDDPGEAIDTEQELAAAPATPQEAGR